MSENSTSEQKSSEKQDTQLPSENTSEQVHIGKHSIARADIFKFVGLLVFFALMGVLLYFLWPLFSGVFEPGGLERLIEDARAAGPLGVLILFALQFLQIVVAFIPGEVTQVAAGILYGPWWGALIILVGCLISSGFIYILVNKLGAPFVKAMVPDKYLAKFQDFEKTGKLNIVVFILFLIPGLPKDTFTYLVPLTDMPLKTFLTLTTVGRIPGVLVSTYAASSLIEGDIWQGVILFTVAAVLGTLGIVFRNKIMAKLGKTYPKN